MSWRVLIVFLMLAAVASWHGGVELGNWLVTRAPETVASVADKLDTTLKLDANGRPITAQPPQPRIDGTLGIPRELVPIEWAIEAIAADDFDTDPDAMKIDQDDDNEQAGEGSEAADAKRLASDSKLPVRPPDFGVIKETAPPVSQRPVAPPVPPGITVTVISWQQSLKKELDQCANVSFFQRPTCLQNVRNKYCAPNDAWGKTADCPARPNDQVMGG